MVANDITKFNSGEAQRLFSIFGSVARTHSGLLLGEKVLVWTCLLKGSGSVLLWKTVSLLGFIFIWPTQLTGC